MIRESKDASFDWFKSYHEVAHIIRELIPNKSARILMLGCGNSKLSEEVALNVLTLRLRYSRVDDPLSR